MSHRESITRATSLIDALTTGKSAALLTFAGQGFDALSEIAALYSSSPAARDFITKASTFYSGLVEQRPFSWSGLYPLGFDLVKWAQQPETCPNATMLASSVLSQPLIFVAQIARYLSLFESGLKGAMASGAILATTGHSQGLIPALLIAESPSGVISPDRLENYLTWMLIQGLFTDETPLPLLSMSFNAKDEPLATPMAAISGALRGQIQAVLDRLNRGLGPAQKLTISLENTRTRFVVSGAPSSLVLLQKALDQKTQRETKLRRAGQLAARPLNIRWDWVNAARPYHTPAFQSSLPEIYEEFVGRGISIDPQKLLIPVFSCIDGARLDHFSDTEALTREVLKSQLIAPVRWRETLVTAVNGLEGDVRYVLDLGPGDGVAKLTYGALRGSGISTLALSTPRGQEALFTKGALPEAPLDTRSLLPQLVRLGDKLVVDNVFTRATGCPPILLPGMTPTTSEVGIVAAAANAGFVAELAGGGQVTEAIFERRMSELTKALDPGKEVVFNALYLDRYLWNLHLGSAGLVQKARKSGAPLCGVTISAGIPEKDEAVALLDELNSIGMWLNAFKPGTLAQVRRVVEIAKAAPQHMVFIHLEGGRAGGHHSWESLDDLLMDSYHLLRSSPNIILCVGGGVGREARATELLNGKWALPLGAPQAMPVDAVFLGTLAMACLEAETSPQVKEALVKAAGTARWVLSGKVEGGVTSGRSQLNADIYYLDNPASRCGKLLDIVAGDAEAVAERRDEIIEALNATARPFFGELEEMTWSQVIKRMIELMAVGRSGAYEDGVWLDVSHRERVRDVILRAEARLSKEDDGAFESRILTGQHPLKDPTLALGRLAELLPEAATSRLHPLDIHWFLQSLCRRPGKPVCFVPVIDADVRRWYKADSLWQAHDDRFSADQVLVIPGPLAVAGILRADEPVAELFGRFENALISALSEDMKGATPARVETLCAPRSPVALPPGFTLETSEAHITLRSIAGEDETAWFKWVAHHPKGGPIARLFGEALISVGQRRVSNPLHKMALGNRGASLSFSLSDGRFSEVCYRSEDSDKSTLKLTLMGSNGVQMTLDTGESTLELQLQPMTALRGGFKMTDRAYTEAVQRFYQGALLEEKPREREIFFDVCAAVKLDEKRARAYGAVTGLRRGLGRGVPDNQVFSLCWKPLFAVLSAKEFAGGLLDLVHLENKVSTFSPIPVGKTLSVNASLLRVEDSAAGRKIYTECGLAAWGGSSSGGQTLYALLYSTFLIRGDYSTSEFSIRSEERVSSTLEIQNKAILERLSSSPWMTFSNTSDLKIGDKLHFSGRLREKSPHRKGSSFSARAQITKEGQEVGEVSLGNDRIIECSAQYNVEERTHPLRAFFEVTGAVDESHLPHGKQKARFESPVPVANQEDVAPAKMDAFADVGEDLNPIHRDLLSARLAGFEQPIVHGMWSAGRAWSFVVDKLAEGEGARVCEFRAEFLGVVLPGERIWLSATQVGVIDGGAQLEVLVEVERKRSLVPALRCEVVLRAPKVAFVFPGQGIQQKGMGMEAYQRSAAARQVWDRSDAKVRSSLGFSILEIVRENPSEVTVKGVRWTHPDGVLNLTQFTQVAMAAMACAQFAELREQGHVPDDFIACGHSVGEYNALGASLGVLPIEDLIDMVYLRGLAMHRLVPRNAEGESGYGMDVIRPHYAGLNDVQAEALVEKIHAETGHFLQIVNYNVRGRQYSVTGEREALIALRKALDALTPPNTKAAWIEVPGIDVPFHSRVLRDGVDDFRETLGACLPEVIDPSLLVDRYIPNLIGRPFQLSRLFVEEVLEATDSSIVRTILFDWDAFTKTPEALARLLLIELLAWQFASPVRWIRTQDLLLLPKALGGMGVQRIVEIGVGYQPTLANMARYSLGLLGEKGAAVEILNVEANALRMLEVERPAPVLSPLAAPEPSAEATPAAALAQTAAATPAAQAPVPAPAPSPSGPSGPLADLPFRPVDALQVLLALQGKVRPEQIDPQETIDDLFDGISSRRNQVLLDIGAEFSSGAIDGAHERPISDLGAELNKKASAYKTSGPYLKKAQDEVIKRLFGRVGLTRADLLEHLSESWSLPAGLKCRVLNTLTLETREGESGRGTPLASLPSAPPADRAQALALLDLAVTHLGKSLGLHIARPSADDGSAGGAVDAKVVRELEARILGSKGILKGIADDLLERLGESPSAPAPAPEIPTHLQVLDAELGEEFAQRIAPRFEPLRHVALESIWGWARRDLAKLFYEGINRRLSLPEIALEANRLSIHREDPVFRATASWFSRQARGLSRERIGDHFEHLSKPTFKFETLPPFTPSHPSLGISEQGVLTYSESKANTPGAFSDYLQQLFEHPSTGLHAGTQSEHTAAFRIVLEALPLKDFQGMTAVVTGASPSSIAIEIVRHLLKGGARVIITTTRCTTARIDAYRSFYQACAAPGAELHIVPFNQASMQDCDAFTEWVLNPQIEQSGAKMITLKEALVPDLLIPFAAMGDVGTLDQIGPNSEAALRALLLGTERLIANFARARQLSKSTAQPLHVLLPLSPNHGSFGGDGLYSEGKAALEVLLHKQQSEGDVWGDAITLCGARIGWVRGTGLMDHNNPIAARLENACNIRTFSNIEMGYFLAGLCTQTMRAAATPTPLDADLTGGMRTLPNLREAVSQVRESIDLDVAHRKASYALKIKEQALLGLRSHTPLKFNALPSFPIGESAPPPKTPRHSLPPSFSANTPSDPVVIVGFGEIGPCGNSRTRFALEVSEELSAAAILELAWVTGLVEFDSGKGAGVWIDIATEEEVAEHEIASRYRTAVRERVGIRAIEPETIGYDAEALPVLTSVFLDRDFTITVATQEEAHSFLLADPKHTTIRHDAAADAWSVTRHKGSELRLPRVARLQQRAIGQIPKGFDFARYGISRDMIDNVDRVSLFNIVATVDAFASAGFSPEELLAKLHPARVACTQGSGLGGAESLRRLYQDLLLDEERQNDILQETLINVVAAYTVQNFLGSYGTMSHPVGACATAALSLESGMDKILVGKADFVLTGGFDDVGSEGAGGFADMSATVATDEMIARGIDLSRSSRANDRRRRGFVEAQGGGSLLLTRGSIALEMGLPIYGILAYSASFGDGINKSIPAPGFGLMASACGGLSSPLARALQSFGLNTNDVALVYKHDTSTAANDPNENNIHDRIQRALGRDPGNPLFVVSQKSLTGHPKGGAAAWQTIGLCQSLKDGVIPGNRCLESIDSPMRAFRHMAFTDETLYPGAAIPLKAGLVTSLGFGHVSCISLVLHPDVWLDKLDPTQRERYESAACTRLDQATRDRGALWIGDRPLFSRRTHRHFNAPDGSPEQLDEESRMLLDPTARLDLTSGLYVTESEEDCD